MKQTLAMLIVLSAFALLAADEVTISTSDGAMTVELKGVQTDGTTTSGSVIDAIADKLDILERDYVSQLKRLDQERAKKLISEIFALLMTLPEDQRVRLSLASSGGSMNSTQTSASMSISINVQDIGWNDADNTPPPPPAPVESKPQPMSAAQFQSLRANISAEDFDDDKLAVVQVAAQRNYFTADQIGQMVDLFPFSDDQVEVVRIAYPKVVDPENGHQLLNHFTYSDDKQKVRNIINQ